MFNQTKEKKIENRMPKVKAWFGDLCAHKIKPLSHDRPHKIKTAKTIQFGRQSLQIYKIKNKTNELGLGIEN